MSLRIAMAQVQVEPGGPAGNLRRAGTAIAKAAQAGCHLVVLPECLDLGWGEARARALAQPLPGAFSAQLAEAARAHGIAVAAGLVEGCGSERFNAALLIDAEGHTRQQHRKVDELDEVVGRRYAKGQRLAVARLPLAGTEWVLGLAICADLAPERLALGHALGQMGAQHVVSPCAWAVPPGHDNAASPYGGPWTASYGELARVHGITVLGVSSVGRLRHGPWTGWPVIGASPAVGPDGVMEQAPFGTEALRIVERLVPNAEACFVHLPLEVTA